MNAPFRESARNFIARVRYLWAQLVKNYLTLDRHNWRWISAASLVVILLFVAGDLWYLRGSLNLWWMIVAGVLFAAVPLLYGAMIKVGIGIAQRIPQHVSWLVFASIALFFVYFSGSVSGLLLLLFYLLITILFIAGALSNLTGQRWHHFPRGKKLLNIFFLCAGISNLAVAIYFLSFPGRSIEMTPDAGIEALHVPDQLSLPDPGQPGAYDFRMFSYGAGNDKHRREFGEETDVIAGTVDGRGFLEGWDRLSGRLRTFYWGFGPEALPLNGRVWMPEGEGPFPVVLIVHGNHFDRDFSDPGYAYIAEHLASHGFLAVSVDENFLNRGLMNFNHSLEEENDARGWLLLKHLERLRTWNSDPSSVFFEKANTGQVILAGHSRGGEAAAVAAFFNTLPCYPDDANERFDFNFGIRGVIAIAPVEGQYSPGNRPLPLADINYLALQGSMDADLESYMGLTQFNRIRFEHQDYHFKAGLYIVHANHGQFNTNWGINDVGFPQGLLLNRRALISDGAQQLVTLVCITSFVKATLGQEHGYVQLFRDYRSGLAWLPETRYISQFGDNKVKLVADFEEDMNLYTTSLGESATIEFEGLAAMYEAENELYKGKLGTKTAMIGWNNTGADEPGRYSVHFSRPIDLDTAFFKALQFDVAVLDRYPGERMNDPKSSEVDIQGMTDREEDHGNGVMELEDDSNQGADKLNQPETDEADWFEMGEDEPGETGFSITLTDIDGNTASVPVSDHFPLVYPEQTPLYKLKLFDSDREAEPVPQHVEIDLQYFYDENSQFDKKKLASVQFVFDLAADGMISIDNLGFTIGK